MSSIPREGYMDSLTYLMQQKSKSIGKFKEFIIKLQTNLIRKSKVVQSNRVGEYLN